MRDWVEAQQRQQLLNLLLTLAGGPGPSTAESICSSQHPCTYLVAVIDVGVRKLPCHELIEHNAVGVDIRLEAEWVIILHSDHLGGLQGQNAFIHHHVGPTDIQVPGCPFPWI